MLYEFPPSAFAGNLASTIAIHSALIVAAILPLVFVWLRTNRPAHKAELWYITSAIALVPLCLIVVGPSLPSNWIPFVVLYCLFFEAVSTVALIVIARRLTAQGQATAVVPIVASLLGLGFMILCLLPATPSAREAAKRMQCSNNLKNIALALLNDELQRGSYLPNYLQHDEGPHVSWRVELLPFLENQSLSDAYDRSAPWDSDQNMKLASIKEQNFVCPSNPSPSDSTGRYFTAYLRPAGNQVRTASGGQLNLGRSNTIAVVEACGQNVLWTEPREALVNEATVGINLPGKTPGTSDGALSSYHTGGAATAMLDGSVRFLSQSIDKTILNRMLNGVDPDEVIE